MPDADELLFPEGPAASGQAAAATPEPGRAPWKVLIADDHRLIIEGVKIKLAELDPGVEAVVAMLVVAGVVLGAGLAASAAIAKFRAVSGSAMMALPI